MHDYLTIVRKKMLRPLLYDYQRTTLYYTIYRTFKSLSSDDFTTISRLFYRKNYDYWLRLFQNLLRLFQPKHYDYCSPLLAIGRKPEKRCGKSRQWFRAAGLTLYRWRRWPLSRHSGCSTCQRSADGRSWPRRAGMICAPLIYLIVIGGCADLYSVRRGGGIWYRWMGCTWRYALRRGTGGVYAACVDAVLCALEWGKSTEKPLQSPVNGFGV